MTETETQVRERPIIFSAPMVCAIIDGRKTQTRRVVKPQPVMHTFGRSDEFRRTEAAFVPPQIHEGYLAVGVEAVNLGDLGLLRNPYARPGDRLWVRETFGTLPLGKVFYRADGEMHSDWKWRSPYHMPHWASRITLEVVSMRVERLQDISEEDCFAEGIPRANVAGSITPSPIGPISLRADGRIPFQIVWERLNGKAHPWSSNPWVWCITFKRLAGSGAQCP